MTKIEFKLVRYQAINRNELRILVDDDIKAAIRNVKGLERTDTLVNKERLHQVIDEQGITIAYLWIKPGKITEEWIQPRRRQDK